MLNEDVKTVVPFGSRFTQTSNVLSAVASHYHKAERETMKKKMNYIS